MTWRWAIGWSGAVLLLSGLPYLIAAAGAPEGWSFAGFLVNPLDGHSYMAKMAQGAAGSWLFHLTYTPEPHDGAFIFTFYLALGRLAALTGLPKIIVFHLARLLAGLLLLLMAFRFVGRVTPDRGEQRLAFLLILTASGLGWLGVFFGAFPIDLWIPEAFVPYSLYTNPHFPLGMALMLYLFDQILDVNNNMATRSIWGLCLKTGLAGLLLAMILPFGLLAVWAVLFVFFATHMMDPLAIRPSRSVGERKKLGGATPQAPPATAGRAALSNSHPVPHPDSEDWRYRLGRRLPWQQIWPTLSAIAVPAGMILYQYWVSRTNPALLGWSVQNVTPAPKLTDFILGYGLVGGLALVGSWFVVRQKPWPAGERLVLCWAATTVVLVYLPFDLQRRLINGLHLPLCILAAIGLQRWLKSRQVTPRRRRLISNGVVGLGLLGTLFVWLIPLAGLQQAPEQSEPTARLLLRHDEQAAFAWLRRNIAPDDVILASPRVGMFVPGQTGARSFYGHPFETIEAEQKKAQVEAFYQGHREAVQPPADYVIYGPSEQKLGRPKVLDRLPVVFSNGEVTVYQKRRIPGTTTK